MSRLPGGFLAMSVSVLLFTACHPTAKEEVYSKVVIYDRKDAQDSAARRASVNCRNQSVEDCQKDAREWEGDFAYALAAAFQSDSACAGLHLLEYQRDIAEGEMQSDYQKLANQPYWHLSVQFTPHEEKQNWILGKMLDFDDTISGEDSPKAMAHVLCLVMKNTGGSVVN
jgi:hypothetical protein